MTGDEELYEEIERTRFEVMYALAELEVERRMDEMTWMDRNGGAVIGIVVFVLSAMIGYFVF